MAIKDGRTDEAGQVQSFGVKAFLIGATGITAFNGCESADHGVYGPSFCVERVWADLGATGDQFEYIRHWLFPLS
jgi:hypothetical protein